MSDARMVYTDEITGLEFVWHGGEYIDVGTHQNVGEPGIYGDDFHAHDVINVWDYEASKPMIERSLAAFAVRCREYLSDQLAETS